MDTSSTVIDGQSILQTMLEIPEPATVIIDMIAEIDESDRYCLRNRSVI